MSKTFVFVISALIAAGIGCFVWGLVMLANGRANVGGPLFTAGVVLLVGTYLFYLRNGQRPPPPPPQH